MKRSNPFGFIDFFNDVRTGETVQTVMELSNMANKRRVMHDVNIAGLDMIEFVETRNAVTKARESRQVSIDFSGLPQASVTDSYRYVSGIGTPHNYKDEMRLRVWVSCASVLAVPQTEGQIQKAIARRKVQTQFERDRALMQGALVSLGLASETDITGEPVAANTDPTALRPANLVVNVSPIQNPSALPKWAEVCDRKIEHEGVAYKVFVDQWNPEGFVKPKTERKESEDVRLSRTMANEYSKATTALLNVKAAKDFQTIEKAKETVRDANKAKK